jgi:peroxiredoxin
MTMAEIRTPVAPGQPAPDFKLPAVDRSGTISLGDYRSRSPLFLALLIGLWCPFCRRQIALMGPVEQRLKGVGVETLAVVATTPENAQLYFKYRPTKLRLASDPGLTTHRAYGLSKPAPDAEFMGALEVTKINPYGDLPEPLPIMQAAMTIGAADGYAPTATDQAEQERQFPQLKGMFMIDRDGVVRWSYVECATEGPAGVGKMPSAEEIVGAARSMS